MRLRRENDRALQDTALSVVHGGDARVDFDESRGRKAYLASLGVVSDVSELLAAYERKLEEQARRLEEVTSLFEEEVAASAARTSDLVSRIEQQDREYVEVLQILEKKMLECAVLKIAADRSRHESEKVEQQIRMATHHIAELRGKLGI